MANTSPAIVNEISGRAWLRHGDGSLTELHLGSKVPAGSDVVTASGATVSLQVENGMPIIIGEGREVALTSELTGTLDDVSEAAVTPPKGADSDRLLAALRDGRDLFDELDPTAAVVAAGGGAGGSSFVRLARLLETTSPLDLSYSNPGRSDAVLPRMSSTAAISNDDETPTPVSVNHAPAARDDAGLADQNHQVRGNVLANDADPDGDPLAITSVGGRTMTSDGVTVAGSNGGTFTVVPDGSYVYIPGKEHQHLAAGETATSTVSYSITDPSGATATATVVVTIAGVNDGPVSTTISDTSSLDAQTSVRYDVSGHFSDPDTSDRLTFTATGLPPGLSIAPNTGIISGDVDHSASQGGVGGRYTATITATDASGATTLQEFHWNITNTIPTVTDDRGATDEDAILNVNAQHGVLSNDSDLDGDTLAVSHVNGSAANIGVAIAGTQGGTFTLNIDGSYTFNPGSAFQHLGIGEKAHSSITYSVSDGEGGTTSATLTVEIIGTNDAPILQAQINQVLEDHAASGNVLASAVDVDNDTLTITTFTVNGARYDAGNTAYLAGVGSILVNADGSYTFTQDSNWNGDVPQITYTATDGTETSSSTLDIHVQTVNDAPLSLDGSGHVAAGSSYVFGLRDFPFSDPGEGHSMQSVIIDTLPTSGALSLDGKPVKQGQEISAEDLASGRLVFYPDASNTGESAGASFEFRVRDNGGSSDGGEDRSHQQTFKLHVDQLWSGYNGNDTVSGGSGDDVLLGDQGGMAKNMIAGTSYNIALLLDLSYSMDWREDSYRGGERSLDAAKKALKHLLENQLATHDGTINVSLITFNDDDIRVQKSISGLTLDNVAEIVNSLLPLETGPNTPYGAAFHETKKWFGDQPTVDSNGNVYKNLTYFLTDGEPTAEKNYDADAEFKQLAEISDVHAIGVGPRIIQDRLDDFDNTGGWFTGSSDHIKQINFDGDWLEGANDPARWRLEGDGTVERPAHTFSGSWGRFTSGKMALTDTTADGESFTVTMNVADKITITNPAGASFSFSLWLYDKGPVDTFKWILLKWNGSEWTAVASGTEAATQTDSNYGPGDYLFQFELNDNSPTDGQLHAEIGGIYTLTENRKGGSQVVRDPSDLTATLTGSQTNNEAASVGDDKIHGGDGSDILFGDAINTDRLPWGIDDNPTQPANLPAGSSLDALKQFLLLKNGTPPTDADLHKFISDNHALFDVQGDLRGGNDELHGGAANDILYGQGGNDLLHGDEGNDVLSGGTGSDTLFGDAGNDVLIGGKGNDILYGGSDSDTFKWVLDDQSTAGTPAVDTIKDFSTLKPADGGDILDLQGLLVGEDDGSLAKYLNFHMEGNDTVIDVNTQGKLGTQGADQKIVLENVDITHDTYGQSMSNQAIINDLLQKGKLIVDHA
ncbi:lysis protein [Achromobacter xylosoxidans]|uniref:retention module-containing protein n=1 Tax=Achromobacter aegrifaciens TaxID=1287736 RepID=UPI000D479E2E|nr:retention module-containing protein [Achromobacter aegrifaciens]MDQ1763879.1 retention module-containing protein [Achromobacter aegrifaciens]PTN50924.1 lysis protein [Achromobacter xylosoxidans]